MPVPRTLLWAGIASLTMAATAFASGLTTRSSDVAPLFNDALFKQPAAPIDSAAVFALDAPMRHSLAQKMAPQTGEMDPRHALLDALADEGRSTTTQKRRAPHRKPLKQ